ncbi:ABC transporter ATP-binding protein [Staphylococcus condimenti]|uniref:ABC transporter ATP-binding protein n=1 Tax=Staphylococcus condimenti TaxID=70255 RepID=A0A143PAI4_9STAP|nr:MULTISPECIES: ABC transporter ATP-binding protein [Staphylococcus]AMY05551.1 iron-enterobactin transporter ATP-binding protein [Staphylococcus condimenti]APR61758.1 iron-enterobactin transporter ATP-binding protein [Staphylococcus condimenti]MDK8644613.1 ABC transporter ATP-binding protein [Staphylococcus condimenti]OFP02693.1 iron-enterobactin transporter ATP-binding protein [Staphylococcus sp. HMSC065E08]PNZ63733.1 ABC transporter ATP-binding protein [Staphylococcus condimenti]
MNRLNGQQVTIGYGEHVIVSDLDVEIPDGKVTSIIGPNGCGKSTLLKALSRLLSVKNGKILLDGKNIHTQSTKEIAKKIAILPQSPDVADGLTAGELVSYGRFPHQKGFGRLSTEDKEEIDWALKVTGTYDFKHRAINDLSGGQRQRVWIAMALAQKTDIIFLDEPTTYLDISHQLEILELVQELNREHGTTIVMVLHDINQAIRFSDHLIAMKGGDIVSSGETQEVLTKEILEKVFNIDAELSTDPRTGKPMLVTYDLLCKHYSKV